MKNPNNKPDSLFSYDYLSSASSHDCTGLIPIAPKGDTELDNYAALYPYLPVIPMDNNPGDQMEQLLQLMNSDRYL